LRLTHFKVTKYRNILDSGWIELSDITAFVGQNEAGKSNNFEALYRINPFAPNEAYNIDEDWPVDDWGNKDPSAVVCQAKFVLTLDEIESLYDAAALSEPKKEAVDGAEHVAAEDEVGADLPTKLILLAWRSYNAGPTFVAVDGSDMITKRVEAVVTGRYGHKELNKRIVMAEILRRFDKWEKVSDLPEGTATRAEKLFQAINSAFEDTIR
jgi:hypothetical protein